MTGRAVLLHGHHTWQRNNTALPILPNVSGNWYQLPNLCIDIHGFHVAT
jgi:hypothetical protein